MAQCQCHNHQQNNTVANTNVDNPDGVIVLGTYIHCDGCRNQILKCLRGYEGVEIIEIDAKNHKVTVKGKQANPTKVAERLRKKSGKHVELISPKPKIAVQTPEKKPEPPKVIEVVLKVYIHCEGCAKEVKRCIHDMEGVQTVNPDMGKNLVTVKGTMDPKKLVEFVNKRGGRHAEIVKQSITENNNNNCNSVSGATNCCSCCHHNYPPQLVHAPQLFSDENPNSCSVM